MRNVNAELLLPRAQEIQNLVQMAYDAGRERGREEAMREQQGFQDPPRFDTVSVGRAHRGTGVLFFSIRSKLNAA